MHYAILTFCVGFDDGSLVMYLLLTTFMACYVFIYALLCQLLQEEFFWKGGFKRACKTVEVFHISLNKGVSY